MKELDELKDIILKYDMLCDNWSQGEKIDNCLSDLDIYLLKNRGLEILDNLQKMLDKNSVM